MVHLKPFFSFYGSKHRISKLYPFPRYNRIVELFAGSAAYSCRYPGLNITLVDKDPFIVHTWKYLTRVSEQEIMDLPVLSIGDTVDSLRVSDEAKLLIGWWMRKGQSTPAKTLKDNQWTRLWFNGGNCSYWGTGIKYRIASQLKYIRHWKIVEADYTDWVTVNNGGVSAATYFVDPPYSNKAGRHYYYNSIDYRHLSEVCQSLPGEVIVCGNLGETWIPFEFLVSTPSNNSTSGQTGLSHEVVWHKT